MGLLLHLWSAIYLRFRRYANTFSQGEIELILVFILDIVMDVKFRKLFDTVYVNYSFSGSFPWVHFNVFTVFHVPMKIINTLEREHGGSCR